MSKKFAGIAKYNKLMNHFSFITKNLNSSYDKENRLKGYIILFLNNQLGLYKTKEFIENNLESFNKLFNELECSDEIEKTLQMFIDNENISIDEINSKKIIFSSFKNKFLNLITPIKEYIDLNDEVVSEFVDTGLIYILYSLVDCKIETKLDDILQDPKYDYKVKVILNNTKLFSNLRQLIMKYCGANISDFVGLINGLTPKLSKD